jgi:hypothetical protein
MSIRVFKLNQLALYDVPSNNGLARQASEIALRWCRVQCGNIGEEVGIHGSLRCSVSRKNNARQQSMID